MMRHARGHCQSAGKRSPARRLGSPPGISMPLIQGAGPPAQTFTGYFINCLLVMPFSAAKRSWRSAPRPETEPAPAEAGAGCRGCGLTTGRGPGHAGVTAGSTDGYRSSPVRHGRPGPRLCSTPGRWCCPGSPRRRRAGHLLGAGELTAVCSLIVCVLLVAEVTVKPVSVVLVTVRPATLQLMGSPF